jgi:hypothetical protein
MRICPLCKQDRPASKWSDNWCDEEVGEICTDCNYRRCADCRRDPEYYMLRKEIWEEIAGEIPRAYLCIGCASKRLGRPLVRGDFMFTVDEMKKRLRPS